MTKHSTIPVGILLTRSVKRLKTAGIATPWLDAELLLAYALGKNRAWVLTYPEYRLQPRERKRFEILIAKRNQRVPLAYLTGVKEFYGLPFRVTRQTLIPRPETELLIEKALPCLQKLSTGSLVADIGTGSGCIAIAIATLLPHLKIIATDASSAALSVARKNARRLGVSSRIRFKKDAHFTIVRTPKLRAIIANLPYVSKKEYVRCQHELRYEPTLALVPGQHGDEALLRFFNAFSQHARALRRLMLIALEVNPRHVRQLKRIAEHDIPQLTWSPKSDLNGTLRFLIGVRT